MNPDLAYLIGAFGDASAIHNPKKHEYYIEYWQKEKEWLEKSIVKRFRILFNKSPKISARKNGLWIVRLYSKEYFYIFKKYREQPDLVLEWQNDCKLKYVSGFFDAEGSAPKRKPGTGYRLSIYQKDRTPLKLISKILMENGIQPGSISNSRDIGLLPITRKENVSRFFEIIKPEHPKKVNSIIELLK